MVALEPATAHETKRILQRSQTSSAESVNKLVTDTVIVRLDIARRADKKVMTLGTKGVQITTHDYTARELMMPLKLQMCNSWNLAKI